MHPFRKLLLVSMGRESSFEKDPSQETWRYLFHMAKYQAMIGVLNDAVHRISPEQMPPEDLLEEWDRLTGKIEEVYTRHERHALELETILGELGLQGCILKGTGLSRLYLTPGRRQCGDIDVWVPGPRKAVLKAFSDRYDVHDILYQECKVEIFDDTVVELHFHPTKMYNPFTNARFQRWCNRHSPVRGGKALSYPDNEFNAVFCMAHMYRHYIVGGLGLRQMMDYYYVLRNLPAERREPVMKTLKRLGMKHFTAATMLALYYNFGLEREYLLCKPDMKRGTKLIEDLIHMGNFGVLDKRNRAAAGETKLKRFFRRNRRTFSNLRYYPREVLWAPLSRLTQYLWRIINGYDL